MKLIIINLLTKFYLSVDNITLRLVENFDSDFFTEISCYKASIC